VTRAGSTSRCAGTSVSSSQTGTSRHMLPAYWQHARRKRRGSGRAASYKLANQASSAGVWRRESTKRRARTSLPLCHACFLRSLSLARPAALPAWVMQPVATASLFLGVMYRVHRAHLSALGPRAPGAQALVARPKKPQPPTEGVFSTTPSTTPSTTTPTQAKKVPSPNFVRLGVG
jgi:hypothetical protein